MNLMQVAEAVGVPGCGNLSGLKLYSHVREYFFFRQRKLGYRAFQSPSIKPTTNCQRVLSQKYSEHSVYQRSDYMPLSREDNFNSLFDPVGSIAPRTLFFSSGMAAVSSLAYFLHGPKKIKKLFLGENAYFETKWLLGDYYKCLLANEYLLNLLPGADVYWFEYPINCTDPSKYPFQKQLNLSSFFEKLLKIVKQTTSPVYLVLDYTLHYLPFNLNNYLKKIPPNLTIFLVTSLQKHRGLGLDLVNAGAITFYSHHDVDDYEYLSRVRAINGTSITQETVWLMPPVDPNIINKIITDSGEEACQIYNRIDCSNLPIKLFYADNKEFKTSFIFVQIEPLLMKMSTLIPYFSDQLIAELILSAKRHRSVLVQGTSFGFPFTRIFKNSERYDNTSSLRIAVGYDSDFNKNLDLVISDGLKNFVRKHI